MALLETVYNPDILNCLANLSNDEVFTPPEVVNRMLDMLPQELFRNRHTTFLDPACKTGVFLREIAKRLLEGLKEEIPDEDERRKNIFTKQLYGIAITEMTSLLSRRGLYCSKFANGRYSIVPFHTPEGNIRFKNIGHYWEGNNCGYCGASRSQYDRAKDLEQHAYEFIHTVKPEEIWKMKFDVIIGNPPYQLNDGGGTGSSAKPIYQHFVAQAKKLGPRYLSMIIPARWYTGGKGLDQFRLSMLTDKHITSLMDYDNFKDVFPGVDLAGGACYFLWDRDKSDNCIVSNYVNGKMYTMKRRLDEFETFIRSNQAVKIIKGIVSQPTVTRFLSEDISSRMPFGIPSTYQPKKTGVPCHFTQRIGIQFVDPQDVRDSASIIDKWKLLIPKAPIAGQTDFSKPIGFYYEGNTRIAQPGECCSESWLVAGAFNSREEVLSLRSYFFTKILRFLLLQTVVSQNTTKKNFSFVPSFKRYDMNYADEYLRSLWNITYDDWIYIDSRITAIGG